MLRASPARAERIAISSIPGIVPAFEKAGEWVAAVLRPRSCGEVWCRYGGVYEEDPVPTCRCAVALGPGRRGGHLPDTGRGGEKAPRQASFEARGEKEAPVGCRSQVGWRCQARGPGQTRGIGHRGAAARRSRRGGGLYGGWGRQPGLLPRRQTRENRAGRCSAQAAHGDGHTPPGRERRQRRELRRRLSA